MHIKKYKEKTANLLICLLVLTLFVTLGLGIIKDRKEAADYTSVSSKYKEETKPTSEADTTDTETNAETKPDLPLIENGTTEVNDNEKSNVVGATTGNSKKKNNYTGGSNDNNTGGGDTSSNENPIPENPIPENPIPENPIPENPIPEIPIPEIPIPEIPIPENPTPENPTPSTEIVDPTS